MGEDFFTFIGDPANAFRDHVVEFLQLCATAIIIAVVIGVVLGVAVARRPVVAFVANNLSGLMRSIPSIVFLIAALPYLGIGFKPAVIALVVIGIPPILLNTVAALQSLDPAIIDAANGMGMNRWQILQRIELPLAMPVIIAGVRTAAVQIIATATLATIIGVEGLGYYIFQGLFGGINSDAALLVGSVSVAVIALIAELALAGLQRLATPVGVRMREADEPTATPMNTTDAALPAASV